MTKQTLTTLSIASTFFCIMAGVLIYAYIAVNARGEQMANLKQTIAEQQAKQQAALSISSIIDTTAGAREQLSGYFLTEKDTISFIAEIENTAARIGVKLETTDLALVPKSETAPAKLKTSFSIKGSQVAVETFIKALESLPYHSEIPKLQLGAGEDGVWQANVEVLVTITS